MNGESSVAVQDGGALTVENTAATDCTIEAAVHGSGDGSTSQSAVGDPPVKQNEADTLAGRASVKAEKKLSSASSKKDENSTTKKKKKKHVKVTIQDEPQEISSAEEMSTCIRLSAWQWTIPAFVLCPLIGVVGLWFSYKVSRKELLIKVINYFFVFNIFLTVFVGQGE